MIPDILILGASGFVGRRLYEKLGPERVLATYFKNPCSQAVKFDALQDRISSLSGDIDAIQHAVILFGETRIDSCAQDPVRSAGLNLDATRSIIRQIVDLGITPVFISTDLVFDGQQGGYREDDTPDPILTYGRQKLAIEQFLTDNVSRFLLVRFPKIVGDRPESGGLLSDWMMAIRRGDTIFCAEDQNFSLIALDDAISALGDLMSANRHGIYHIGGAGVWNRVQLFELFIKELRRFTDTDVDMRSCSIDDFPEFAEKRPHNTSLNSEKLCDEIGFVARDLADTCKAFIDTVYSKNMQE